MFKQIPKLTTVLTILLSLVLVGCMGMARDGAMSGAYRAYNKGNYQKALTKINQAESYNASEPHELAESAYLKAQVYESLGRQGEAMATYKYIAEQFGDTQHGYLAKQKLEE